MKFSERIGKTPIRQALQRESMDEELRLGIWNLLTECIWLRYREWYDDVRNRGRASVFDSLFIAIWRDELIMPIDSLHPEGSYRMKDLRKAFFEIEWFKVYDLLECIVHWNGPGRDLLVTGCNDCLQKCGSAYRLVNGQIAEISSAAEIAEIERAIMRSSPYSGVTQHLDTAVRLMADRTAPDYRNSIKESISAVESLANHLNGGESGSLGGILRQLERGRKLHPALSKAFTALYGYTSDAQGIRHALMSEPDLTHADARFMLICCSAFINHVIDSLA